MYLATVLGLVLVEIQAIIEFSNYSVKRSERCKIKNLAGYIIRIFEEKEN
jgi:hypothetical protein